VRIHRWDKNLLFRSTVPVDLVAVREGVALLIASLLKRPSKFKFALENCAPRASDIAGPHGVPFARLVPASEKVCVGLDLAEALARVDLPESEAKAWHRDLRAARSQNPQSSS